MFDWYNKGKNDQKQKDYAKPFIGGCIDSKCPLGKDLVKVKDSMNRIARITYFGMLHLPDFDPGRIHIIKGLEHNYTHLDWSTLFINLRCEDKKVHKYAFFSFN